MTVPGLKKSHSYGSSERLSNQRDSSHRQINRDHYVTKSDKNTTITLNNSKYCTDSSNASNTNNRSSSSSEQGASKRARDRSNSPDFRPCKDRGKERSSSNLKFEPIKIQILNSNYVPSADKSAINANNNRSEDSMDYESSSSEYESTTTTNKYNPKQDNSGGPSQVQQSQQLPAAPPQSSSSVLSGLTATQAAALLQNSHNLSSSLNAFHSHSYKPSPVGLVVNQFNPASNMYSNGYDRLWNTASPNNFYTSTNIKAPPTEMTKEQAVQPQSAQVTAKSSKEGFKLLVSNLHPKVSEDDVLVIYLVYSLYYLSTGR